MTWNGHLSGWQGGACFFCSIHDIHYIGGHCFGHHLCFLTSTLQCCNLLSSCLLQSGILGVILTFVKSTKAAHRHGLLPLRHSQSLVISIKLVVKWSLLLSFTESTCMVEVGPQCSSSTALNAPPGTNLLVIFTCSCQGYDDCSILEFKPQAGLEQQLDHLKLWGKQLSYWHALYLQMATWFSNLELQIFHILVVMHVQWSSFFQHLVQEWGWIWSDICTNASLGIGVRMKEFVLL